MIHTVDIRHWHLFCGLGGGAKGFNRGEARLGNLRARFRCLGGIDIDPAACRDFETNAGVPATCLDLFDRDQYTAFHGREPPRGWREQTPADVRRVIGRQRPHIVFLSAPCKGFSGLLSETASASAKYQALNRLTLRGIWLMLEALADDLPELIIFENVPRIATRGRHLLDHIIALLRCHGYAVAEHGPHDCGEIGNLAQSRKRYLMVARHMEKVPNFLYEPVRHPLRGVGEVLDRLPLPLSGRFDASGCWQPAGGAMHRMPSLHWKTWVRLAFVEAGSDWRSLNRLQVADGFLSDYAIAPEVGWHGGVLGVQSWDQPARTVTSRSGSTNGCHSVADPRCPTTLADFHGLRVLDWEHSAGTVTGSRSPGGSAQSVADPRINGHAKSVQLGVRAWGDPAGVVTGKMFAGGGPNSVADPRISDPRLPRTRFNSAFRIVRWGETSPAIAGPGGAAGLAVSDPRPAERQDYKQTKYRVTGFGEPAGTVIAASSTGNGGFAVADPRYPNWHPGASSAKLRVSDWGGPAYCVTGAQQVASGALSVADPRPEFLRDGRAHYHTAGQYGVVPWDLPSGAIAAHGQHDNGRWSVADPRDFYGDPSRMSLGDGSLALPAASDRLVCVIRALDDTWHRPFTTLELAALQGLVEPEEHLELDGLSDSAWRERIGNAVPPPAAAAIAGVMGRVLLMTWSGETYPLSKEPVWVRPIAATLMAAQGEML